MKKLLPVALFFAWHATFAQPPISEWTKVKQIKLLESTRADVERIFPGEDFLSWTDGAFSGTDAVIYVKYSSGNCSEKYEEWNVPAGTVTGVKVTPKNHVDPKAIGIDYSGFRKERTDPQRKSIFVRYDKTAGVAISFFGGRVDSIHLFPSKASYPKLCDKPKVKEYYSSKRWARVPVPKNMIIDYNMPANVVDLAITPLGNGLFAVSTKAVDPENDVLTYNYFVTSGKVVGKGANVVWDPSDARTGTYTITAAVDDGIGFSGKYIKKTITIP
jgi:hypothetical protein